MSESERVESNATDADRPEGGDRGHDDGSDRRVRGGIAPTSPPLSDLDREELTALVEELRSENLRLREEYVRAQRSGYRRSAGALVVLGLVAVIGALVFPLVREVLLILGAVGLFGGTLTWYLTPDELVTAAVGRSVYEAVANTGGSLRDELGLADADVYVPVDQGDAIGVPVRLFVPQSSTYRVPDSEELSSLFVVPDASEERGIALRPTASRLVREFEESTTDPVASEPKPLAAQLVDALVEQFELVDGATPEVDAEAGRITVRVNGGPYDEAVGFDHPVASFLGTGVAAALGRPTVVDVNPSSGSVVITCRWK